MGTDGPYVADETGALYHPKLIRPAPPGSQNVEVPRVVAENRRGRLNWKREAIYEGANRIHQYILNLPDQKASQMNNPFRRRGTPSATRRTRWPRCLARPISAYGTR